MRSRYAVALSILGAYVIASYFILHAAIDRQRAMQRVISVSGQQRMYSQRIAMFADAIVARPQAPARVEAEKNLDASIRIFRDAHRALTVGDASINPSRWQPAKVRRLFFDAPYDVDLQARTFLDHAQRFDERARRGARLSPADADLGYLLDRGPGVFLRSLDAVVAAYSDEQRATVATFEALQLALLALGLGTLVVIWFAIFLPMEREIGRQSAALERSAATDALTGASNRNAFVVAVERSLANDLRAGDIGALLMIDIDRFKTINDTYGHVCGDETIVRVADILRAHVRAGDAIARIGGDEFAVFAPARASDADLRAFVQRLGSALQFDLTVGDGRHRVTASIGVARVPTDATSLKELMIAADVALYAAKRAGRARHAFSSANDRDLAAVSAPG